MNCSMDLREKASKLGVKYFVLAFSTLNTDSRTCLVPATNIDNILKNGCTINPIFYYKKNSTELYWELFLIPETFIQIPWRPQFAWIQCELYENGKPSAQCPRRALKKQIEEALKLGYVLKAGIEPEFFLLNKDGTDFADKRDTPKELSHCDGFSILRNSDLLCKIHDAMELVGWKPYNIVHEASMCQYEINFAYADALTTADRYFFLKFMIKELAELEGFTATFMPVPLDDLKYANGLHVNLSLWSSEENINLLPGDSLEKLGISSLAHHFIGGLLEHVQESCAVFCPTVNSYKRISNTCGSPGSVNWGGNNKTVLLRVPTNDRFEHRLPDGSTNLYLTLALFLAAGLDGIEKKTDPGQRTSIEVKNCNIHQFKQIPKNLFEALNVLESSKFVKDSLGEELLEAFIHFKRIEWNQYSAVLTQWETNFYLNC